MASATKYTNIYASYGAYYGLYVEFVENSTSVANNTSSITLSASISSQNRSGWSAGSNSTLTLYWHDNRENYDRYVSSISFSGVGVGETKTTSGTINATHNDDGTLSGYAYVYFAKGGSSAYAPASSGLTTDWTTLTTIARASQPSINTWPNNSPDFNIGDTITIHMNRKSSSFTHKVVFKLNSYSYTIAASGVTDNVRFNTSTIADNIYAQIPNSTVANGTIEATTYNGSTVIGTKSCPFSAKAVNVNPTFDVSYQDTNSTTTAITNNNQKIIRNNSTLQINGSNLSAKKSSSLSSIKTVINGVTYNGTISGSTATFNIGTLNVSSNTTAAVTLTDSRGLKTTKNLTIQVLDWVLPSAIITAQRENNFYDPTTINVDGSYSSLDGLNTLTMQMRYKKTTDADYGSYQTLQDNTPVTVQLDNNYEWNVQVLLTDRLGTKTYNVIVERGIPIIFFDRLKRSVGVNGFPHVDEGLTILGGDILNILGIRNDTWVSGTNYSKGKIVCYKQTLYENITGNNNGDPRSDTTNWQEVPILVDNMKINNKLFTSYSLNTNVSGNYTNCSLSSAWINYNRKSYSVNISLNSWITNTDTDCTLFTLPEEYRPDYEVHGLLFGDGLVRGQAWINTAGVLKMRLPTNYTNQYFSLDFMYLKTTD